MPGDVFQVPDVEFFTFMRRLWNTKLRDQLMLDLANLDPTGCNNFWQQREWLDREPSGALLQLRDELRGSWGNLSAANEIDSTLRRWLGGELAKIGRPAFVPYDPVNTMEPNPWNLRVTLAFAVINNFPKLGVCSNPKCPRPYFLRSRAGQKFCNRKACLAYGQREQKLKWWHEHRGALGGRPRKNLGGKR
jgi:hypothetical protein